MKKLLLLLLTVIIIAGCSNMIADLSQLELKSGETVVLSGTDGKVVTGIAVDSDTDGTPDGIDVTGDGIANFTIVAADSTPAYGVYAVDTNGDSRTDMYITVSPTGTSTISTAIDGTGTAVTVEVAADGTVSLAGDDAPTVTSTGSGTITGTGTDPGTETPAVAATTDINGDGNIDTADTAILSKLTFAVTGDTVSITGADSSISGVLNIPASYDGKAVTSIANSALKDCTSLTTVTIPASVTDISGGAFENCTSLTSLNMLPTTAPTAASDIFDGIAIPVSLTYPEGATGYDTAGTVWVNPSAVLKEGDWNADGTVDSDDMDLITFSYHEEGSYIQRVSTSITGSLIIPSTYDGRDLYWINDNAFEGCTSLTSVTIPGSVTAIGDDAFKDCSSLTTVSLSEGLTAIGENVFWGCTLLTDITLPESLLTIGIKAFYECSSIETLTLPSGITSIGYGNFIRCTSLTSINWPPLVASIPDFTFVGCTSLSTFEIPSTVTTLEGGVFQGSLGLTAITIPANVTAIGNFTFNNSGLEILTMLHSVRPNFDSRVFYELTGCTLRYPVDATSYLYFAPWNDETIFPIIDTF